MGPGPRSHLRSPLLEFQDVRISYFPGPARSSSSRGSASRSARARRSGWSANPAAASRRSRSRIMRYPRADRAGHERPDPLRGPRTSATMDEAEIRATARPPDRDGLPGSDGEPEPGHDGRPPADGSADAPRRRSASAAARERALRDAGGGQPARPRGVMGRYPHQLSGGQQQRIVIAMALIAEPALLVMDEPTTGLDVTVEAAVLDLVRELRQRHNSAILFISHNLGTVARVCDRVGVMYGGELVEEGGDPPRLREPAPPLHARPPRLPADARPRQARRSAHADSRAGRLAARAPDRLRLRRPLRPRRSRPRASPPPSPCPTCPGTSGTASGASARASSPRGRAGRPSAAARRRDRQAGHAGRRPVSGRSTARRGWLGMRPRVRAGARRGRSPGDEGPDARHRRRVGLAASRPSPGC